MKIFHAFVDVWHKKGSPTEISSCHFYVTASSEKKAKQIITKEVKTWMYWKHTAHLEEIKMEKEYLRHLSSQSFSEKLGNEALLQQMKIDGKKHAHLKEKYDKRGYWSIDFKTLLERPWILFSCLAEKLSDSSEILIVDGVLYLFDDGKKETFIKAALMDQKKRLIMQMKEMLHKTYKELDLIKGRKG